MPKAEKTFVDVSQKPIAGYRFGSNWFGCNGRTISGLCGDSFKSEADLVASYDSCFGQSGSAGGLIRVYSDGTQLVLRKCPTEMKSS